MQAVNKSIYRLAKDISTPERKRSYWWVNALVTGRLKVTDSEVLNQIDEQIAMYEREAKDEERKNKKPKR